MKLAVGVAKSLDEVGRLEIWLHIKPILSIQSFKAASI